MRMIAVKPPLSRLKVCAPPSRNCSLVSSNLTAPRAFGGLAELSKTDVEICVLSEHRASVENSVVPGMRALG